jgi:hypothetical protein
LALLDSTTVRPCSWVNEAFRAQGAEKAGVVQRCVADMSYG